ncbi:hypothetical protein Efla_006023 [Eimeria flavescens]
MMATQGESQAYVAFENKGVLRQAHSALVRVEKIHAQERVKIHTHYDDERDCGLRRPRGHEEGSAALTPCNLPSEGLQGLYSLNGERSAAETKGRFAPVSMITSQRVPSMTAMSRDRTARIGTVEGREAQASKQDAPQTEGAQRGASAPGTRPTQWGQRARPVAARPEKALLGLVQLRCSMRGVEPRTEFGKRLRACPNKSPRRYQEGKGGRAAGALAARAAPGDTAAGWCALAGDCAPDLGGWLVLEPKSRVPV